MRETPCKTAKKAIEGYCWYQRQVKGIAVPSGDSQYELFATPALHGFIVWLGGLLDSKTPELQRDTVVAAMYATFAKNELEAKSFWSAVARGGPEFDDTAPATVLDVRLKTILENKKQKTELKPAQFYQGCIFAWNAYREDRTLQRINSGYPQGALAAARVIFALGRPSGRSFFSG